MSSLPLVPALQVIHALRTNEVVVTTMGSAREWPRLSRHALDFHFVPSAMGQAPALGLGLALAQPHRHVIVLNGDGCMLMNLGCLATIAASGPSNLTLIVFDNGIYEVTGGQTTAAAASRADFAAIGRASGLPSVARFAELEAWRQGARKALALPGPRLIVLNVQTVGADYRLESPGPIVPRLEAFRAALT